MAGGRLNCRRKRATDHGRCLEDADIHGGRGDHHFMLVPVRDAVTDPVVAVPGVDSTPSGSSLRGGMTPAQMTEKLDLASRSTLSLAP
jgi:hypothetical protein